MTCWGAVVVLVGGTVVVVVLVDVVVLVVLVVLNVVDVVDVVVSCASVAQQKVNHSIGVTPSNARRLAALSLPHIPWCTSFGPPDAICITDEPRTSRSRQ